jgi:hypothetical protein
MLCNKQEVSAVCTQKQELCTHQGKTSHSKKPGKRKAQQLPRFDDFTSIDFPSHIWYKYRAPDFAKVWKYIFKRYKEEKMNSHLLHSFQQALIFGEKFLEKSLLENMVLVATRSTPAKV